MNELVTAHIDRVLDDTTRLREIRRRLGEMETERTALEAEARQILQRLGPAAAASDARTPSWKDQRLRLPRRIIDFLAANPGDRFRAAAVAAALGYTHEREIGAVRHTLARLDVEGRVTRTGYGIYMHKPGAV
jgi:hypothetical protein